MATEVFSGISQDLAGQLPLPYSVFRILYSVFRIPHSAFIPLMDIVRR
jgi:hypothetical protein